MVHSASTENEQPAGQPFTLCADDYGLSPAVSDGILQLLEAGRLSATGAMTSRPAWRRYAPALKPFGQRADLGVHLNLTCGAPLGAASALAPDGTLPTLPELMKLMLLSAAARADAAAEIERQLDAFEAGMGRAPDFIDGHQHVHALPGLRGIVLAIAARRYGGASRFYVRDPVDCWSALARRPAAAKAAVVASLAFGFGRRARRTGLRTNVGFSGFSAFDPRQDFADEFEHALISPGRAHLAMCHPGGVDDELRAADPVIETRPRERDYFASARFQEFCARRGLELARLRLQ